MIKLTISSLLGLLITGLSLEANAIPSFPRELACVTQSGVAVQLVSNNGFWSQAENGRYNVQLSVANGNGAAHVMSPVQVNNDAKRVRGNDEGNRRYIFVSPQGQEFQVELEFNTQNGRAAGIKVFRVVSSGFQLQYPQPGVSCNVSFHGQIEI